MRACSCFSEMVGEGSIGSFSIVNAGRVVEEEPGRGLIRMLGASVVVVCCS